jgi:hypothetical protein
VALRTAATPRLRGAQIRRGARRVPSGPRWRQGPVQARHCRPYAVIYAPITRSFASAATSCCTPFTAQPRRRVGLQPTFKASKLRASENRGVLSRINATHAAMSLSTNARTRSPDIASGRARAAAPPRPVDSRTDDRIPQRDQDAAETATSAVHTSPTEQAHTANRSDASYHLASKPLCKQPQELGSLALSRERESRRRRRWTSRVAQSRVVGCRRPAIAFVVLPPRGAPSQWRQRDHQ